MGDKLPKLPMREGQDFATIRRLYPELSEEESAEAYHFLTVYLETVEQILEGKTTRQK